MAINPTPDLNPKRFISVHKFWFKFFGQWYIKSPVLSVMFWIHLIYRTLIWWLLTVFPVGGEIIYVLRNGDDVGKVAEGLYLMLSEAYMAIKLMAFLINKNKVLKVVEHLESEDFYPTEPEHIPILKHAIWKGRMVSKGYLYMCLVAITVGCLMPITENFAVLPTNVQYPYFDVMSTPAYQLVYLSQIYSKTAVVLLDGVIDTIMPALIAQALGQLDILAYNLENIQMLSERYLQQNAALNNKMAFINHKGALINSDSKKIQFEKAVRIKLGEFIKHHSSIISYVYKVEDAFSAAAAAQFMLSALVICLIGIQILSIEEPMSHPLQLLWTLVYFCCMMSEVFMLCWFGDEVINKSLFLRQAAFNGNWMDYPEDVKSSVKIFMERVKVPLRLTAGKIFILSLDTFTNLLKWSYNAFAVMRNMKT